MNILKKVSSGNSKPKFQDILYRTFARKLSVFKINDSLKLFTPEKRAIEANFDSLRLDQQANNRPLVMILSYLRAKENHLEKYAKLYFDHGFDALVFQVSPWRLFLPESVQKPTLDILRFLQDNDYYDKIVIHGFSVGGYLWCECMHHMDRDLDEYRPLLQRFKGQVWDSTTYIMGVSSGVANAMFPNNRLFREKLQQSIDFNLDYFQNVVTRHYRQAEVTFNNTILKCPALFIVSKMDSIGSESRSFDTYQIWKENGIDVTWKCFESSPHVMHYCWYKDEYTMLLENLLKRINL